MRKANSYFTLLLKSKISVSNFNLKRFLSLDFESLYYYNLRGLSMVREKIVLFIVIFTLIIPMGASCIESNQRVSINEFIITDNIPKGEAVLRSNEGYNWWSYVPESLQKQNLSYILLEESHAQIEDYEDLTIDAALNINKYIPVAEAKQYILVTVVIPRDFDEDYYPQGINYNSFRSSTPDFYYRPDLKVNNILSEFVANLTAAGYTVSDKMLVAGFSAGGMWANRYTLLHPERVKAAAMGQAGGWLAMPITEFNGTALNWPMGVNDLNSLTGTAYTKQEVLKEVPQYVFIGDQDTASTYYSILYPNLEEIKIWGMTDSNRLENQSNYLIDAGYNVNFKLYPGIAHSYTAEMLNDVKAFFDSITTIDSDGDGLTNDEELYLYETNPDNPDTDGDSCSDYDEINLGTDPNNPEDYPETSNPSSETPGFTFLIATVVLISASKFTIFFRNKR